MTTLAESDAAYDVLKAAVLDLGAEGVGEITTKSALVARLSG